MWSDRSGKLHQIPFGNVRSADNTIGRCCASSMAAISTSQRNRRGPSRVPAIIGSGRGCNTAWRRAANKGNGTVLQETGVFGRGDAADPQPLPVPVESPKIGDAAAVGVSRALRSLYDGITHEDVPADLQALLTRLG